MASKVWVVGQQLDGVLHRMSWEAISAGQRLAELVDGEAAALLLGSGIADTAGPLAETALGIIYLLEHESLSGYMPGPYIQVLAAAIENERPDFVIFPHTYQSVEFVPRLAQTLNATWIPEVTAFEKADGSLVWHRPIFGGKLEARVRARSEGPALVSVQSGAFAADEVKKGTAQVQTLDLQLEGLETEREILGVEQAAEDQVDLSQAEIVVAVGRGIGDADKIPIIEELAAALGGEIGASRPVIDNGWLPRDRQIGSSGQVVAPKLYLAAGISGAIQHLVGMKGSKVIVAINKDASAPIFGVAHYGIVGDIHEIVPALTTAIREVRTGS